MGRYICIGILYQAEISGESNSLKPEDFFMRFPPELFDYSRFEEDGIIRLNPDTPGDVILFLRRKILDFCSLPNENSSEKPLAEEELNSSLKNLCFQDFITQVRNKHYYTLSDDERPWIYHIGGEKLNVQCRYLVIFYSACKFYPDKASSYPEITQKLEGLIEHELGHIRLCNLIQCFVTL